MKHISLLSLIVVFLLPSATARPFAPAEEYMFDRIDNMKGLSNNEVVCIHRDSRGFMWFGTNSGLNRYDGSFFRTYRVGDRGMPYSRITSIVEDGEGNMWLTGPVSSTYAMYEWRTDMFHSDTDSLMRSRGLPLRPYLIRFDPRGTMWACYADRGVYCLRPDGSMAHYPQNVSEETLSPGDITSIAFDQGNVWMINSLGVLECLDPRSGSVVMRNTHFSDNYQSSTFNKSIFLDSDGEVWVYPARSDEGAALLDPRSGKWRFFYVDSSPALSADLVRAVGQDSRGAIWIATDHGGINVFDKKQNSFTVLKNDRSDPRSLGQDSVISLWCDPSGGIVWAGTYKNGVSLYHPDMFRFSSQGAFSISDEVDCNAFCRDRNGNLWIGTNGGGLICYNEQTGQKRTFTHDPADPTSLSSDIITALAEDSTGVIWIGTYLGGMCSWDGRRFTRYEFDEANPNTLSSRSVYGISEDDARNLWIGTLGGGVDCLDPSRRIFTHHTAADTPGLTSNYVLSVSGFFAGRIYVCTAAGLSVIDTASGEISLGATGRDRGPAPGYGLPNYAIRDSRGAVWMASDNEITVLDPSGRPPVHITPVDGLPVSEVVSLVEDRQGNVWAGTRGGLVRISRDGESRFRLTCYYAEDGLPGHNFNHNAVCRDTRGWLYFGTTKGYIGFDPMRIVSVGDASSPRFTDLAINGRRVLPYPNGVREAILHSVIDDTEGITLPHGQNEITFSFSAMNYIHPDRVEYRYRLDGFDREWKRTFGQGVASYSNLSPGSYTLLVESSGDEGKWSKAPLRMYINVRAPLWLTWWAIVIYVALAGVLIQLFLGYMLDRQRKQYVEAQRRLEIDKKHEMDEMKFRFFTNVSHEFKTPVTLILTPLEQLLRGEESPEKRSLLEMMRRNARSLLTMVNEILDLRKLEVDKMVLRPAAGEIIGFIKEICNGFSNLASERSVRLTFTTWIEELYMDFDADKMTKILTNLLANAFQFTKEGSVDVSVSISEAIGGQAGRNLCIRVADTGIGIPAKHRDRIFDRFYRVEEAPGSTGSGTGLGLHMVSEFTRMHGGGVSVESSQGEGSVFTVTIPIRNSSLAESRRRTVLSIRDEGDRPASANTPATTTTGSDKVNGGGVGKPLLLIVDDNDDFREFVSVLFEGSYKVLTAADGGEAWERVLEDLPDLILADVMMPGMDGYEFCRLVKGDIRTSHIPVVLLTAKSSDESKYSGIEAGADDYISKPFDIDMLLLKISKIIERQKTIYESFRKRIDISPSEIEVTTMDEKFVRKAVAIVEENIDNTDFLVEDLCQQLGISRVYFYKKLLALTDKTPSEFIRFIRLKRAADLLEKSQLFVGEVAYKVGFNDPKYFRGYFKKEFGVTPSEYKKRFEDPPANEET